MTQRSLVSIIIPNYNREKLLGETLDSLIAQDYVHWEAIVVDDGSTDRSAEVGNGYAATDARISFRHRTSPVKGASACRNEGARLSKGEYLIFLDSDDLLAPWCLSTRLAFMDQHPHLGFAIFPVLYFNEKMGDMTSGWGAQREIDDLLYFTNGDSPWQTTCPIWRREAFFTIGDWDIRALSWQDWEYHIRAVVSGIPYIKVYSLPDTFYRCGGQDKMSNHKRSQERLTALHQLISIMDDLIVEKVKKTSEYRRRLCAHYFIMAEVIAFYQYPIDLKQFYSIIVKKKMLSRPLYNLSLYLLLFYSFIKKYKIPFFSGVMSIFFEKVLMKFCFHKEKLHNNFTLDKEQWNNLKQMLRNSNNAYIKTEVIS